MDRIINLPVIAVFHPCILKVAIYLVLESRDIAKDVAVYAIFNWGKDQGVNHSNPN